MANNALMTRETVRDLLGKQKSQIAMALPSHIDADRFIRVALTTINKQPGLLQCTQESLLACLMDCSQLGLEPDSTSGQAYLIPFKDKDKMICTLIVGYRGLIDLAYRHSKVKSIRWHVVHEKDTFEYEEGLEPKLKFIPTESDDEGPLTHAFAIAELEGGAKTWVVLNRKEVMKAKKASRSANSSYSPWTTFEEAMWAKTAVRALSKRMPRSAELIRAIATEDELDGALNIESTLVESQLVAKEPEKSGEAREPAKVANDDPLT